MLQKIDRSVELRPFQALDGVLYDRNRNDRNDSEANEQCSVPRVERHRALEYPAEIERLELHRPALSGQAIARPPMNASAVRIGTVDAVRRYPIKSLRSESPDFVQVDATGIRGDRTSAFIVRSGHVRVGKTYRGKENDRLHVSSDVRTGRESAAACGVDVELRLGSRFFDDAPISLLVDRWLDDLNRHIGYHVEWERFRPNFFVRADDGFAQMENDLIGAQLQLGSVRLHVRSPIERCVTTTYHPEGSASDPRILRFLAQERAALMGVYCDVIEPGVARAGDTLARL
jgi:uncharacterized protein YcbX